MALVAYLVLIPLALLIYSSFTSARPGSTGALSIANYIGAYSSPQTYTMLVNSLIFAGGSCLLSFLIGTSLAWIVERTNAPFKTAFFALNLVPLLMPGILGTIAWIFLLSPKMGIVNVFLMNLFSLPEAPFNLYSLPGLIWVEALHLAPLVFLMMGAAFRSMDPSLEESATVSGSGAFSTLRRVTLPLMLPAILSVALITFIRAVESFEVPALIGLPGRIFVFTNIIYMSLRQYPADYGLAGAISVSLLVVTGLGIYLYGRATARVERFSTVTGKGYRPRVIDVGRWRYLLSGAFVVYLFIAAGLPLLVLLWSSLLKFYAAPSLDTLSRVSLNNYGAVLANPQVGQVFLNSAVTSVGSATLVMLLTSAIAWIVIRTRIRGRRALDYLAFFPIAFPGLPLGVALVWVYLTFPIPIYGTIWILMVAYITRFMPYGMRACSTSMIQIHKELEEASTASGASWWQTFRRVTLPLLRPGLLAGWIYVAIISLRELSSSILLYAPGSEVLSILIFDWWEDGAYTLLSALAILMVMGLCLLAFAFHRLGGSLETRF